MPIQVQKGGSMMQLVILPPVKCFTNIKISVNVVVVLEKAICQGDQLMPLALQRLIEINQVTVNVIKQVVTESRIGKHGSSTHKWFY